MSFTDLLVHSVYLRTKASSQTPTLEWEYTWTDSSTATACRMSPITDEMRLRATGDYKDVEYKAFFASGTSIAYDNQVKYNGNYYRVRGIKIDSMGHHKEVLLERTVA